VRQRRRERCNVRGKREIDGPRHAPRLSSRIRADRTASPQAKDDARTQDRSGRINAERKTLAKGNVARFDSPAKSFNVIITQL
jgi:hypothetical protein